MYLWLSAYFSPHYVQALITRLFCEAQRMWNPWLSWLFLVYTFSFLPLWSHDIQDCAIMSLMTMAEGQVCSLYFRGSFTIINIRRKFELKAIHTSSCASRISIAFALLHWTDNIWLGWGSIPEPMFSNAHYIQCNIVTVVWFLMMADCEGLCVNVEE